MKFASTLEKKKKQQGKMLIVKNQLIFGVRKKMNEHIFREDRFVLVYFTRDFFTLKLGRHYFHLKELGFGGYANLN